MNVVLNEQVGAELDALREARTYKTFLTLESAQGPASVFSTCRTCEICMSRAVGRPVRSVAHLVHEAISSA